MKLEDFKQRKFKNGVVYLGNAREILPLLKEDIADVCVTSPPYNLNKRYSDYKQTKTGKSMTEKYEEWYPDDLPEKDYRKQQVEMIDLLVKSCKSSVFYNHRIRFAWHGRTLPRDRISPSNLQHPWDWVSEFKVWSPVIWDRCGIGNPVQNRHHSQYEFIYQIGRPKKFFQKKGEHSYKNIWRINPSKNSGHVCTFPEQLVENCIFPTTDIGDTVIDPYLGSGTTAIVALKSGRKFIGIEIDPNYFKLACKNIKKAEDERRLAEKENRFYSYSNKNINIDSKHYISGLLPEAFDIDESTVKPDGIQRQDSPRGKFIREMIEKEKERKAAEEAKAEANRTEKKAIYAVAKFFGKLGKTIRKERKRIEKMLEWEENDKESPFTPSRTFNLGEQESEKITYYKKEIQ